MLEKLIASVLALIIAFYLINKAEKRHFKKHYGSKHCTNCASSSEPGCDGCDTDDRENWRPL